MDFIEFVRDTERDTLEFLAGSDFWEETFFMGFGAENAQFEDALFRLKNEIKRMFGGPRRRLDDTAKNSEFMACVFQSIITYLGVIGVMIEDKRIFDFSRIDDRILKLLVRVDDTRPWAKSPSTDAMLDGYTGGLCQVLENLAQPATNVVLLIASLLEIMWHFSTKPLSPEELAEMQMFSRFSDRWREDYEREQARQTSGPPIPPFEYIDIEVATQDHACKRIVSSVSRKPLAVGHVRVPFLLGNPRQTHSRNRSPHSAGESFLLDNLTSIRKYFQHLGAELGPDPRRLTTSTAPLPMAIMRIFHDLKVRAVFGTTGEPAADSVWRTNIFGIVLDDTEAEAEGSENGRAEVVPERHRCFRPQCWFVGRDLASCPACGHARYCSPFCLRKDVGRHKPLCRPPCANPGAEVPPDAELPHVGPRAYMSLSLGRRPLSPGRGSGYGFRMDGGSAASLLPSPAPVRAYTSAHLGGGLVGTEALSAGLAVGRGLDLRGVDAEQTGGVVMPDGGEKYGDTWIHRDDMSEGLEGGNRTEEESTRSGPSETGDESSLWEYDSESQSEADERSIYSRERVYV